MSREIAKITAQDIEQIMQIERTSFSLAWEKAAFLQELEENVCARYIGLKEDGQLLGYAGMWLGFDGEAHVTNVAVRTDMRRQGIGEELMWALMQLAADCGMVWMSLECRRSNAAAQSLYHKLGFIDVGYRKRYYPDNSEDALVMCRLSLPEGDPDADEDIVQE
ncbi:MAG: ribosomal protein S18-alanine N-acetyltransferase [Eubacteriales bacterium]|nr:ribosomal protein S18-alanine N-acetyltransferase [Eubacteriales bacterium]